MFSSRVGVATQRVVPCSNWGASLGKPTSTTSARLDQTGHVEYWKAQCGESRTLRLGGGKERKLLPICTFLQTHPTLRDCTLSNTTTHLNRPYLPKVLSDASLFSHRAKSVVQ